MIKIAEIIYLYAFLLIPVIVFLFWRMLARKKKTLQLLGNRELINRLMPFYSKGRIIWKFLMLTFALIFIIIALLRIQIGSRMEKANRKGADIIIALDISNSMLAEDIQPNRLSRSKQAISKLIDKFDGDRIGIVIFAGKAFVQLPLTNDYAAAKMFLETINTNDINEQGTALGAAISLAAESFDKSKNKIAKENNKAIIIITDGENHEDDALEQAKVAQEQGIMVNTIGMGLPDGAPIPLYNNGIQSGYKKDRDGNTIVTKLDEAMLQKIAASGMGAYVRASNSNAGLQTIFEEINKLDKKEYESKTFSDYEDRFQYFVAIALLLLVVEIFIFNRKSKIFNNINLFGKNEA